MSFAHSWVLHLLWLLPLTGLCLALENRRRVRAMKRFAEPLLLYHLTGKAPKRRRYLKGALLLCAQGAIIFALAGPRWGSHFEEVSQKKVDVMILVDVSPSMLVEDVHPNRLERAKREIADFLRLAEGERVGLIAFSGVPFVLCPLTPDYGALLTFLNVMAADLMPIPGTDLGAAIEKALSSFDFEYESDRFLLVVSDGEDNEQEGIEAARKAWQAGVKILALGVGTIYGGPVPEGGTKRGFKKNRDGQVVLSKLDEGGLKRVADLTGGSYALSGISDEDLKALYFDGIKSKKGGRELREGKIRVAGERFPFFAILAFLFLSLEYLIRERQSQLIRGNGSGTKMIFLAAFLVCFSLEGNAFSGEDGDELYEQGRFAEAEKIYLELGMENPGDLRYPYNRGCAAYQGANYQSALAAFSSVLERAEEPDMRFRAAYNLGNTAYKMKDFSSAFEYFKAALRYNPESEDGRYNLELVLRALERLKKARTGGRESPTERNGETRKEQAGQSENEQRTDRAEQGGEEKADPGPGTEDEEQPPGVGILTDATGVSKELFRLHRHENASTMDMKKAEALLDNVREDPSSLIHGRVRGGASAAGPLERDW